MTNFFKQTKGQDVMYSVIVTGCETTITIKDPRITSKAKTKE